MTLVKNIRFIICVFLIANSVICAPSDSEEENGKQKEESNSSESESGENNLGTVPPSVVEKLKEEIIEKQEEDSEKLGLPLTNSPKDIETFLEKEEEERGEEMPVEVKKLLTDEGDCENFLNFFELFDKISSKVSENEEEEEIEKKSPEEMEKMKKELFESWNTECEKTEEKKLSHEEFEKFWKKKEEEYGENFPRNVGLLIAHLKELEIKEESATTEKASEEVTEVSTSSAETSEEETAPEAAPKEAFILRNKDGDTCILAKFHSTITITFPGKTAEQEVKVSVPHTATVTGKCGGSDISPELQMSWQKLNFSFFFDKVSEAEDSWGVTEVELSYNTSDPLFDGAAAHEIVTAKSKKGTNFFVTPLGKSYLCQAQETILLDSEDQHVATVHINEVHVQPYDVEDGKFSASHHCDKVVFDALNEEPFVQDETIPLAVGCTLALITLLILVGFSVHRAYQAAKVDYNEMP